MRCMQVGSDEPAVARDNIFGHSVGGAAILIDGDSSVMTTQAGFRCTIGLADGGIEAWACKRREAGCSGFVGPQRRQLRRVSVVRRVTGTADAFAGVPRICRKIVGRPDDRRLRHCRQQQSQSDQ